MSLILDQLTSVWIKLNSLQVWNWLNFFFFFFDKLLIKNVSWNKCELYETKKKANNYLISLFWIFFEEFSFTISEQNWFKEYLESRLKVRIFIKQKSLLWNVKTEVSNFKGKERERKRLNKTKINRDSLEIQNIKKGCAFLISASKMCKNSAHVQSIKKNQLQKIWLIHMLINTTLLIATTLIDLIVRYIGRIPLRTSCYFWYENSHFVPGHN